MTAWKLRPSESIIQIWLWSRGGNPSRSICRRGTSADCRPNPTGGVFPSEGREGYGYEGIFLGRLSSGAELVRSRTYATNSQAGAGRRVDHFQDIDAAIEAFIDCEWNKGIDGV